MSTVTLIASVMFLITFVVETIVQSRFLSALAKSHPVQFDHSRAHASLSAGGSARGLVLYLRDRNFRLSLDKGGVIYCRANKWPVVFSYWATAVSGAILLIVVGVYGW